MGGALGNVNAQKHGKYSWATVGRLPSGCAYVKKQCGWLLNALRNRVAEAKGEVTDEDLARCRAMAKVFGLELLGHRDLRLNHDSTSVAERSKVRTEIKGLHRITVAKAAASRVLTMLGPIRGTACRHSTFRRPMSRAARSTGRRRRIDRAGLRMRAASGWHESEPIEPDNAAGGELGALEGIDDVSTAN